MPGVLLKSDRINNFEARGEHGLPVYRSAPQLRSLIAQERRLVHEDAKANSPKAAHSTHDLEETFPETALEQKEPQELKDLGSLSRHLAIPHINELGDTIDWYSPIRGFVIPWRSATTDEQASAKLKIEKFIQGIARLTTALASKDNLAGGVRVSQLLPHVSALPGHEHIFLVGPDKIPVLTFWGFKNPGELDRAPLHFMYPETDTFTEEAPPAITEPVTPVAPVSPMAQAADKPDQRQPPLPPTTQPPTEPARDWKRWLWLALALLLLAGLLLFFLRACSIPLPGGVSGTLPVPAVSGTGPTLQHAQGTLPTPGAAVPPTTRLIPGHTALVQSAHSDASGMLPAGSKDGIGLLPALSTPTSGETAGAASSNTPPNVNNSVPPHTSAFPAVTPPVTAQEHNNEPNQTVTTSSNLIIPANVSDNHPPEFLNGHWQATSGLQDSQTGLPIRLNYQFNQGEGQVMVNRGNGQQCSAPVSAAMQQGSLQITPNGSANCTDGSTFVLPPVRCIPNGESNARCTGQYGNAEVPLAMKSLTP